MSGHDDEDEKVGYGRPPQNHQFKRGRSGNPLGRPRKQERALTERQLRRDIFAVAELPTTIRTKDGVKDISLVEAILMRMANKALEGHGPSGWRFLKIYEDALAVHNRIHAVEFRKLEEIERHLITFPEEAPLAVRTLNFWRRMTRRP